MKEKQLYTAPAADLLVVRFEENIMSYGDKQAAGRGFSSINGNISDYTDDDF